ncbi:MAG: hypothetical protein LBL82_03545 [Oscillospiraceae bacterium]|jgi:hypothetical protein|nr:hypothetical protein [Oscillospiraceae bacterium]
MAVTISKTFYPPFGYCIKLANGDAEALVTIEVGPRVISYKTSDGRNLFYNDIDGVAFTEDPRIKETFGKKRYDFRGGHRMSLSPENVPYTYYPDDEPLHWTAIENGAVFTQKPQPVVDYQYEMTVVMAESGTGLTVTEKITNLRDEKREAAAWGITQMEKGGLAVCPQKADLSVSPLPDRIISVWPYAQLCDKRFRASSRYITLKQDVNAEGAFKFGANILEGWTGYILGTQMFVKKFPPYIKGESYPDFGVNYESYTDKGALEVECLSPFKLIGKGESVSLTEQWFILENVAPPNREDDAAFADYMDSLKI